jgi:hypothetical protein
MIRCAALSYSSKNLGPNEFVAAIPDMLNHNQSLIRCIEAEQFLKNLCHANKRNEYMAALAIIMRVRQSKA